MSAPSEDDRFQRYVDHANSLPLLTADELALFAETGQYPTVRAEGTGVFWMASLDTQFVIRLRRTLLAHNHSLNAGKDS